MITQVHIKNYRSLEDVDVRLGPLTVLVGRNGAGKTNFVDSLSFVQDALLIGMEGAVANRNGLASLRRWMGKGRSCEIEIEVRVKDQDLLAVYGFTTAGGKGSDFRIKRESCRVERTGRQPSIDSYEINEGKWVTPPSEIEVFASIDGFALPPDRAARQLNSEALFLPSTRIWGLSPFHQLYLQLTGNSFFSIHPDTMREPQKFSSARRMGSHGQNFSSALRYLRQQSEEEHGAEFPDLLAALRRVVDDVSDAQVRTVGGYLVTKLRHDFQ